MINIYEGSILDCDVDAIVNPANGFLRHGAGLARIIADAATIIADEAVPNEAERIAIWRAENKVPTIATGDVHVTSAGLLPFKGVIHAVGPVWKDGSLCEKSLLSAAYDNSLAAAIENDWDSIAFPAISCGLFRFPVEVAAPIAVESARAFEDLIGTITFALMDPAHIAAWEKALAS